MTKPQIAIMTWYSYQNLGTVLQAVALNKAIRDLGFTAFDVAYDPTELQNGKSDQQKSLYDRIRNKIMVMKGWKPVESSRKTGSFESFITRYLPLSSASFSEESLSCIADTYDAYVCGSDQVWSPRCFDPHYYLDFVNSPAKKIAYAPSFGCERISDPAIEDQIEKLLSSFSAISVREESGADLVEDLTGHRPQVVVDPTLLVEGDEWRKFEKPYEIGEEPYCLFYFLGSDTCNYKAAVKIAKSNGLRILSVPVFQRQLGKHGTLGDDVGPAEFLYLIRNASLICTDSFHGMVFSAIFERPFIPFERFDPSDSGSQNTRVYNFLKMIDSPNLLLSREKLSLWRDFASPLIDFSCVSNRIEEHRLESLKYLKAALRKTLMGEGKVNYVGLQGIC